ncbi:DnaJ homolog subfamily C member 2 (Gliosarcoma-related antigen MIDA1) (Zuotin-related factor 1) [Durusdinium trenchii]|uniref:DnaJ homolog subfamily C member 2 (Gliosarcoma-related antigen MIDA1) (Zuotin-related factor 1) n=1 Tax=Durusdinium trenchii TaxID=1381693 RepID=A0ABP0L6B0_9DINO
MTRAARARRLEICDAEDGSAVESVVCGATRLTNKRVECAGLSYHQFCLRFHGLATGETADADQEADDKLADAEEDAKLRAAWEERKKNQVAAQQDDDDDEDLYELLGIGHLGFSASEKQIKKAYQKAILVHHPDKLKAEERERAQQATRDRDAEDPMFLRVQRAWEILGNKEKRRGYDSQFAFDDAIPSAMLGPDEDFYEVYGPVFERNARFSVKKPVPSLGDDGTAIDKVRAFYRFWTRFDSWRDFSKFDEFKDGDLEHADSRMEKRWMLRQNEIQRTKAKKKENERVYTLVQQALKVDPRLKRAKEEERQAKEREFQEKKAKREAEEEARRQADEQRRREEEEAERARKEQVDAERAQRQSTKKAFKKQLRMLRRHCDEAMDLLEFSAEQRSTVQDAHMLFSDWFSDESEVAHLVTPFEVCMKTKERAQVAAAMEKVMTLFEETREAKRAKEQEEQEARQARLREEEARQIKRKEKAEAPPWSPDELSSLQKATKKFPGGTRNRWLMICNYINSLPGQTVVRTQEDCLKQSRIMATKIEERGNFAGNNNKIGFKSEAAAPPPPSASTERPAEEGVDEDGWTQQQQQALEEALQKFPSSMEKNERWKAIAKSVDGKTKKECVARFKFLRAKVLQKRQSEA